MNKEIDEAIEWFEYRIEHNIITSSNDVLSGKTALAALRTMKWIGVQNDIGIGDIMDKFQSYMKGGASD